MIRLVTVGTGTVSPSATRSSPSHFVEAGSARVLMDCGAGTVHALARLGLPWRDITHLVISHFHADHLGEVPALLFAMRYGAMEPRSLPLPIIGPRGLRGRLEGFASALGDWVLDPGFPVSITELDPGAPASTELVRGVTLDACKTRHTEESIALSISASGSRLVYTADTGPSDVLADWARDCDLLLAECSLPESRAMDIHLTPRTVAEMARRARAKRLVLTHLYPPVETEDILGIVGKIHDGPACVARDGDRFEC